MKTFILIILSTIAITTYAQDVQTEIDQQVWVAFTKAWEANNGEGFNAIHTDDVWRINPGRLLIGSEYKDRNADRMQGQSKNSIIEFSFESRSANGNNAYDVGYYRITNNSDGRQFVGRFHVALIKVEGTWKIRQDWDTDEINGVKLTAESLKNRKFKHYE